MSTYSKINPAKATDKKLKNVISSKNKQKLKTDQNQRGVNPTVTF